MKPRWRIGNWKDESPCMIFRDGRCVGMLHSPELAEEMVNVLNGAAKNDREFIAKALSKEANRIFNEQQMDYPSNVLDRVSYNLRCGMDENLTEKIK